MLNILEFSKLLIDNTVTKEDIVIDATCGNGNDTLYLAKRAKFVYGFDIQKQAIENTNELLTSNNLSNYSLINDSHSNIEDYIKEEIGLVIFNLGYLPKGDKSITTNSISTINAINSSLKLIKENGLCILVVYTGHDEGKKESSELLKYCENLNRYEYNVLKYDFINKLDPPYILCIEKRKKTKTI